MPEEVSLALLERPCGCLDMLPSDVKWKVVNLLALCYIDYCSAIYDTDSTIQLKARI